VHRLLLHVGEREIEQGDEAAGEQQEPVDGRQGVPGEVDPLVAELDDIAEVVDRPVVLIAPTGARRHRVVHVEQVVHGLAGLRAARTIGQRRPFVIHDRVDVADHSLLRLILLRLREMLRIPIHQHQGRRRPGRRRERQPCDDEDARQPDRQVEDPI